MRVGDAVYLYNVPGGPPAAPSGGTLTVTVPVTAGIVTRVSGDNTTINALAIIEGITEYVFYSNLTTTPITNGVYYTIQKS